MSETPTEPGWYPHPKDPTKYGYFDGKRWVGGRRNSPPDTATTSTPGSTSASGSTSQAQDAAPRAPESGWGFLQIGMFFVVAGGVLYGAVHEDEPAWALAGLILAAIGGLIAFIGSVAVGVTLGMARYEYDKAIRTK